MALDSHIHMAYGAGDTPRIFLEKTEEAGIGGGAVFSLSPEHFNPKISGRETCWKSRLDTVLAFTAETPSFAPFFWIDPLEPDALEQLATAREQGIRGFKVICDRFFPEQALAFFTALAETKLPLMFHSGILWDGKVSSAYNRPISFECLLSVPGLRFSMAHISWPWCDEMIALFGKFQNAETEYGNSNGVELFIDTTPGTPFVYRREVLRKLYLSGYDLRDRVFFGSDGLVNDYPVRWTKAWLAFDREILASLDEEAARLPSRTGDNPFLPGSGEKRQSIAASAENVFSKNFRLFQKGNE